jgi:DNA processing protein
MKDDTFLIYKLSSIKGFGVKTLNIILERIRVEDLSLQTVFDLEEDKFYGLFPEFGKGRFSMVDYNQIANVNDEMLESEYQQLQKSDVKIISILDQNYPKDLIQTFANNAPPLLFCKGNIALLQSRSVAIVGSRDVDALGIEATETIAKDLAKHGTNVVSGYAKGVDRAAHFASLDNGGTTTMVLSCGINSMPNMQEVADKYDADSVLIISQFDPNQPWSARNAMVRNRLVCSLSQAVIVIHSGPEKDEKGRSSGTFAAGKTALELGLPVFVMSPEFFNPKPKGNADLLTMGAVKISDHSIVSSLITFDTTAKGVQSELF